MTTRVESRRRGTPTPTTRAPTPLRELKELEEARHLRAFRELLAARGVRPSLLYVSYTADLFTCVPCWRTAVASLGWTAEQLDASPVEHGVAESYRRLSWHVDASDPAAADDDGAPRATGQRQADEVARLEAHFFADRQLGLFRLCEPARAPDDAIWLWTCRDHDGDDVTLVGTDDRARLLPLLTALNHAHRDHQRRSGLVLIGNESEGRARRSRVSWDDLVLPHAMKDELRGSVKEFFAAAALYRRHGIPHRRGVLLAGPPGNGKTSVIRAIASEVDLPVVVATLDSPHDVHNTRCAFQRAAQLAPAIVCFEDIDALVGEGPGLSQFLNLLDGLEPLEGVLVVATTNRPDRIDPAVAKRPSRFDRVFVIPEPDEALRREYLDKQLGADAPAGAAERLAVATEGYSVAFLKELVLQARLAAVRRGDDRVRDADLDAAVASTQEHLRLASRGLESRGGIGF